MQYWIGIDNGVSGSIGIIDSNGHYRYYKMPIKRELSYTKKKQWLNRIDVDKLLVILRSTQRSYATTSQIVLLERPMVNPTRWKASSSAIRALEATLIVLETLGIPYSYCDSKEWQKNMLPKDIKGSVNLKKASFDIGKRLFPMFGDIIKKQKDADGILIAEWARRMNL